MDNIVLLSVVVPVYNVEKYIERCVRSLLEQTYPHIEYIFIDDCSSDNSFPILNSVVDEYPKRKSSIRILQNEHNMGVAKTRERGIRIASGTYINTCDSDDWYDEDMFQSLMNAALIHNSQLVISDMLEHNESGKVSHFAAYVAGDLIANLITGRCIPFINTSVFHRNIISNPDFTYPECDMGDDLVLSVEIAFYSGEPIHIPFPYYHYRFNDASITKSKSTYSYISRTKQFYRNSEQIINFLRRKGLVDLYSSDILFLKHRVKSSIFPVVDDNEAFKVWRQCYPEIVWPVIFSRRFSSRTKFIYFATHIWLYHFKKKIFSKR